MGNLSRKVPECKTEVDVQDNFRRALRFTLHWEGSTLTQDPDDPGGATNYGVSIRFLKDLPLKQADLDGDLAVTWKDVAALDEERAARIYRKHFWDRLRGDDLPPILSMVMFDTAVNCGCSRSIKWLQYGCGVDQDGILGPRTFGAAMGFHVASPEATRVLARLVITCRRAHYWRLLQQEWAKKYIVGWVARTDALEAMVRS